MQNLRSFCNDEPPEIRFASQVRTPTSMALLSRRYRPMTTWFVSRHPGALQWMQQRGPAFDRHVHHLAPAMVQGGDTVIGTLPVHLAAQVCARGATYLHLALATPPEARGRELSAQELLSLGATLQPFNIHPVKAKPAP